MSEAHSKMDSSADRVCFAKRDERLIRSAPMRERLRPVARASEGAGEECRSDERSTLQNGLAQQISVCFAKRDERLIRSAPVRERNSIKMG
jgi:hypothetical protein